MFNSETAQKKWAPLLEHADCEPIKDSYRKAVTATLLENTELALKEQSQIREAFDTETANSAQFNPTLIALVRRAMPSLIAYDVAGVQPMTGPTGLIFAMVPQFKDAIHGTKPVVSGSPALFDAANPMFSGLSTDSPNGKAMTAAQGEDVKEGGGGAAELKGMGFKIDKTTVTAGTRALKASYTMELAQDLKAIHGLDAEAELANILSTEILAEINREVIDSIANQAVSVTTFSGQTSDTPTSLGARWGQEKFQALIYYIEKQAQSIGIRTRRGKGNFVIVSPHVGAALAASGSLNYADGNSAGLNIDTVGNTFAGTLNGMKVFVDPYRAEGQVVVGYKGASPYDAGMYYCPYVPLTMVKAVGEDDFQPRIAFKTRYGLAANPLYRTDGATLANGGGDAINSALAPNGENGYFAKFSVTNI
jgi:hypothetical protein